MPLSKMIMVVEVELLLMLMVEVEFLVVVVVGVVEEKEVELLLLVVAVAPLRKNWLLVYTARFRNHNRVISTNWNCSGRESIIGKQGGNT